MIVTGDEVARFVERQLQRPMVPPFTCMGIERDGEIIGGVVFNLYIRTSINMTVAGKGWTRGFFRAVGQYVFGQLGCVRLECTTEQDAVAALAERLGGKREGVLRDKYGQGRDGIVVGILAQEYRFSCP